jgi:hypothetical protein
MSLKIYQISTSGSSSNASLTYNFDNVAKGSPDNTTSLDNIKALFNVYDINTSHVSFSTTAPNKNGSTAHQLSYYDNEKNSTIDYTVNFLHVCPSPVNTSNSTSWSNSLSIILECKSADTDKNLLLIIIPLSPIDYTNDTDKKSKTYGTPILSVNPETNINNLALNVNSVTQTDSKLRNKYQKLSFDINAFIPSAQFNIYIIGNNKFIYTNSIKYDYKAIGDIFNNITTTITTTPPPYSIIYKSASAPSKQNILVQNDIYIDCYKVSESSKIDGGIVNTNVKPKEDDTDKNKNIAIEAVTGLYFGGLILYAIIVGIMSMVNTEQTETYLQQLLKYKNSIMIITGCYIIILISILFSM